MKIEELKMEMRNTSTSAFCGDVLFGHWSSGFFECDLGPILSPVWKGKVAASHPLSTIWTLLLLNFECDCAQELPCHFNCFGYI